MKFVPKSWGYELWIENNDKYCGKKLFCAKDKYCSFHYHKLKEETFYVASGRLIVFYSGGDSFSRLQLVSYQMPFGFIVDNKDYYLENVYETDFPPRQIILEKGDKFHIDVGMRHLFYGLQDTEFYEFSTHHEDSDSYRLTDSCK